jgi:hypothetical protein
MMTRPIIDKIRKYYLSKEEIEFRGSYFIPVKVDLYDNEVLITVKARFMKIHSTNEMEKILEYLESFVKYFDSKLDTKVLFQYDQGKSFLKKEG